jgi:MYXO-CTERM domain-containing protein
MTMACMHTVRRLALALPLALAALSAAPAADAFCGFYVAGADAKLFNNATMVVMMREGTRTVLAMQNNYQGPPENFAMVVPVPIVLQKENVKTLPVDVFDRVDRLASPRLVEYWEQDPCFVPPPMPIASNAPGRGAPPQSMAAAAPGLGVKIEAQFTVGEYEIVILSASNSTGLDTWLRQSGYKIPEAAEPLLRPYVQNGMKFFVAKVDATKVRFEKGMAKLSPLRFHYDTDTFTLPVRLGLVNSAGTQDLIVHILARGKRYEMANYKNVTIPTNIDVDDKVREQFGAFYAALFDRTTEENPGAVVTEYAWGATSCDPCPSSPLDQADFATLGGDVMPGVKEEDKWMPQNSFVLTRLHARYRKDSLGEDLIFKEAAPIGGGREVAGAGGKLETGATTLPAGEVSNFQGRYAIRHPWTGPITCKEPRRGIWGGPPSGTPGEHGTKTAQDLAFAPRGGVQLASLVRNDVPELKLKVAPSPVVPVPSPAATASAPAAQGGGCGSCGVGPEGGGASLWAGIAAVAAAVARRRRR